MCTVYNKRKINLLSNKRKYIHPLDSISKKRKINLMSNKRKIQHSLDILSKKNKICEILCLIHEEKYILITFLSFDI